MDSYLKLQQKRERARTCILAEFEQLMATTTGEAGGGSTELLLLGMETADAELLQRCAIPHQFSAMTLEVLPLS